MFVANSLFMHTKIHLLTRFSPSFLVLCMLQKMDQFLSLEQILNNAFQNYNVEGDVSEEDEDNL